MATYLHANIHPAISWVNTNKQTGCHAPLVSNYSGASKYVDVSVTLHLSSTIYGITVVPELKAESLNITVTGDTSK